MRNCKYTERVCSHPLNINSQKITSYKQKWNKEIDEEGHKIKQKT